MVAEVLTTFASTIRAYAAESPFASAIDPQRNASQEAEGKATHNRFPPPRITARFFGIRRAHAHRPAAVSRRRERYPTTLRRGRAPNRCERRPDMGACVCGEPSGNHRRTARIGPRDPHVHREQPHSQARIAGPARTESVAPGSTKRSHVGFERRSRDATARTATDRWRSSASVDGFARASTRRVAQRTRCVDSEASGEERPGEGRSAVRHVAGLSRSSRGCALSYIILGNAQDDDPFHAHHQRGPDAVQPSTDPADRGRGRGADFGPWHRRSERSNLSCRSSVSREPKKSTSSP